MIKLKDDGINLLYFKAHLEIIRETLTSSPKPISEEKERSSGLKTKIEGSTFTSLARPGWGRLFKILT